MIETSGWVVVLKDSGRLGTYIAHEYFSSAFAKRRDIGDSIVLVFENKKAASAACDEVAKRAGIPCVIRRATVTVAESTSAADSRAPQKESDKP
jgi:hypothetical protein